MKTGTFFFTVLLGLFFTTSVYAYVGPGAGITMLGALWAVVIAIVLTLAAVLFWPIRTLIRKRKNKLSDESSESATKVNEENNGRPD